MNEFVPSLRIPILSCPGVYISGFPGRENTLRVVFPDGRPYDRPFLPLKLFRLALNRAPGPLSCGRVKFTTSIEEDGSAMAVDIDPREGENGPPFSITLSAEAVKEIGAAFRIAEVLQDHYERFSPVRHADMIWTREPRLLDPALAQDGSLLIDDEETT